MGGKVDGGWLMVEAVKVMPAAQQGLFGCKGCVKGLPRGGQGSAQGGFKGVPIFMPRGGQRSFKGRPRKCQGVANCPSRMAGLLGRVEVGGSSGCLGLQRATNRARQMPTAFQTDSRRLLKHFNLKSTFLNPYLPDQRL